MEYLIHTIILGIVEGLTEFIPVSSTAHLLMTTRLLGIDGISFFETLAISIQCGAILAAIWFFWKTIWKDLSLIPKVFVAFIPTAVLGLVLYPYIKLLFATPIVISIALIVGGIIFLFLKPIDEEVPVSSITYKQAFFVGLIQSFSFIPGVSRSGATLIGGSLARIPRLILVPFSFLLAIPTIFGATFVSLLDINTLSQHELILLLVGAAISFFIASVTIRFFISLLTKKPLSYFGWYRIIIGVLLLLVL